MHARKPARLTWRLFAPALTLALAAGPLAAQAPPLVSVAGAEAASEERASCRDWSPAELTSDPTEGELRCRWGITGRGRFGLLSYLDVPVYQTTSPMPGTHLVGLAGHAGPADGESFEEWERRVLRASYGPEARMVHRSLELLDPFVAGRIIRLEAALAEVGVDAVRRETWRSPDRQAFLFQQGRSRPGPLATTTLTSWHSQVDPHGVPAGRAVDYDVRWSDLERFHEIARAVGLSTFGADSNDPGHVFLPDPRPVPGLEIVLLRLLPRVPVVTLATGLPVDRALPRGGREALHQAVMDFIEPPYVPSVTERAAPADAARIVDAPHGSGVAAAEKGGRGGG